MLRQQRKRFFSSSTSDGTCSTSLSASSLQDLLPMTVLPTPPNSGNHNNNNGTTVTRMAPGRSHSSSAAYLRQRVSPSAPAKQAWRASDVILPSVSGELPYYATGGGAFFTSNSSSNNSHQQQLLQQQQQQQYNHLHNHHHHHCSYTDTSSTSTTTPQKWWTTMVVVMTFMSLSLFGMYTYETNSSLQQSLALREHEMEYHLAQMHALESQVQKLRSQSVLLNDQIYQLEQVAKSNGDASSMLDLETQRKLFHLEHAKAVLEQGIQASDKRIVQEKFGEGPYYYVEMKLEFHEEGNHDNSNYIDDNNVILIETAHIDDMPHSVHLFLEQVSHGLYDNTYFHRNAAHIVLAGPSTMPEETLAQWPPSLRHVLFQEYSAETPHKQYTLGYPGRPGGPDFYINVRDNSALHGPNGQRNTGHYTEPSAVGGAADPCFGHIVNGFEVVQQMQKLPVADPHVYHGHHDVLLHPVRIVHMRVVAQNDIVGAEQHHDRISESSSFSNDNGEQEQILL